MDIRQDLQNVSHYDICTLLISLRNDSCRNLYASTNSVIFKDMPTAPSSYQHGVMYGLHVYTCQRFELNDTSEHTGQMKLLSCCVSGKGLFWLFYL